MLSTFYVTFSTLAVPGVMLTRRIGPRWTIPGYMMGWGSMAMFNAACRNFAEVLVVRLRKCKTLIETLQMFSHTLTMRIG